MVVKPFSKERGLSLLEMLIAVAIAAVLMVAISGVVGNALNAERNTRVQNEALQQGRFAMQRMVDAVAKTRRLMIPLGESPATTWKESERDVLAVALDPTLDRDNDGWADGNNDKDYLDVNNNGSRDADEPQRIDEDHGHDMTNDGASGIVGIDDDGDGFVDEDGDVDDDEDSSVNEDGLGRGDEDDDGTMDEDPLSDLNDDNAPGLLGVDDDYDGAIDEGHSFDDDEDGSADEDWVDPVVFYLNGTTLMQRLPNLNPTTGMDYTEYPIAENVSELLVKRILGGNGGTVLVDITLTISVPGAESVTLNTVVGVGSGL